ncbi:MAG TPA: ABC transporter permease [Bacillota bacterium]|nr:ABC transporter permease [Bacillota bacterium]HOH09944.1 ABC transporter permease [Bacillota bacterium]HOY88258.1 ABC transporter permease [Bacillota bacterium]HPI01588.1 ABC transporter permease [Bacillota bacterium]HPM63359.1 ABC transporter permease [Bacillota bacterium]
MVGNRLETVPSQRKQGKLSGIFAQFGVPIFFTVLCVASIIVSDLDINYLIGELLSRLGRNLFIVLSLLIPVTAGIGLNFGIVVGAMSGQIALIIITFLQLKGLLGFVTAMAVSVPISVLFGYIVGSIFNKAKGREMITGMIMGFFANGVYQLLFLMLIGTLIPVNMNSPVAQQIMLSNGVGLRNTIDLSNIYYSLDNVFAKLFNWNGIIWTDSLGPWRVPLGAFFMSLLLCILITFLMKTKLGQNFRAIGQDMAIAEVSGIKVDKVRITAVIYSTVLAAWGQLIFLQNLGSLNTFNAHEQVGMFSVAALLVGGASVKRANIWNAIAGVLLFHTLFVVSPLAGQKLFGEPQIGEWFRQLISYSVIAVALAMHAIQNRKR